MSGTQQKKHYIKNFVFGVEDSLVSTTGLLSGIAAAGVETSTVLLTGVVLIFVEAISMGAGSFLSEKVIEKEPSRQTPSTIGALIMFFSYFAAGSIPLAPYLVLDYPLSIMTSVFFALGALFVLGYVGASLVGGNKNSSAIRMLLVGGVATVVGVFVGMYVDRL